MSTIFHLDLDAFFVSVERIFDPSLEGKPVIVGANPKKGRGVVAACSYEARKYGLHSAMPIKKAYELCPNGIYIGGHHKEYSRFSKAVKRILEKYAPMIQQSSVDEFFMDFTGCKHIYGSFQLLAAKIQKEIKHKLGLPCSIGIASNKTVAKVASDFMKPEGITYVMPGMEKEFLAPLPVQAIPGVGKSTLKKLNKKGIFKVADVKKLLNVNSVKELYKNDISLVNKANGKGRDHLLPPQYRKSISKERTFGRDVKDRSKTEEVLFKLTSQVCQLMRDKNWQAATVSIKLRYANFHTITRAKTIKPSDDDKEIFTTALKLFRKNYNNVHGVRLIGIRLNNFSEYCEQQCLFDFEEVKKGRLLRAVTKIRDRYGYSTVQFGRTEKIDNIHTNPFHPEGKFL